MSTKWFSSFWNESKIMTFPDIQKLQEYLEEKHGREWWNGKGIIYFHFSTEKIAKIMSKYDYNLIMDIRVFPRNILHAFCSYNYPRKFKWDEIFVKYICFQ